MRSGSLARQLFDSLDFAKERVLDALRPAHSQRHLSNVRELKLQLPRHPGVDPPVEAGPAKKPPLRVTLERHFLTGHNAHIIARTLGTVKEKVWAGARVAKPEWANRIEALRKKLGLTGAAFAQRIGVSPMAISRWQQGSDRPTGENLIQLGRLAGDPDCWYFWEQAGLSKSDIARMLPELEARLASRAPRAIDVEAWKPGRPGAGKEGKVLSIKPRPDAVSLPLLKDAAAAGAPRLVEQHDVERFILVDRNQVPHPGETTCIRVAGRSMFPTLDEGYIVAVDTHAIEPQKLVEKMVAARDPDGGITIKWLRRDGDSWLLVPQHTSPEYPVVVLRPHGGWKIVGEVIWWMGWPSGK